MMIIQRIRANPYEYSPATETTDRGIRGQILAAMQPSGKMGKLKGYVRVGVRMRTGEKLIEQMIIREICGKLLS